MGEVSNHFNPFPGLRPFTEEEDYLFFGREAQSTELLRRLSGRRAFWQWWARQAAANPHWSWPGCSRRYTAA
jgi:hypothetical protein